MGKAEAVEERRKKNGARIAARAKGAIEVNFNLASILAAIQSTEMFISGRRCFAAAAYRRRCRLATFRRADATKENRKTTGKTRQRGALWQHTGCGWCTLENIFLEFFWQQK